MSRSGIALDYRGVTKSFEGRRVMERLDFQLPYGELIGIFGRSGAGKSLLLRMAIGLESPDGGHIFFENRDLARLRERDFYDVRCKISYVFQSGALFDSMTVEENLAYPLRLHEAGSEAEIHERVNSSLALVGLEGTNRLYPSEISGGMQKRVGLLRATMLDPLITLLDEPTAGLDPMNVRAFSQNLLQLKRTRGFTGLFVTHDIACAFAVCDRIAVLNEGRIYALDTVEAMRLSRDPMIRSFIDMDYTLPEPAPLPEGPGNGGPHAHP